MEENSSTDQDSTTPSAAQPVEPAPPEVPKVSSEDSLLQAAASELSDDNNQPIAGQPVVPNAPRKSHKKVGVILLVVIVLAGLGAGVYALLNKTDSPQTSKPRTGESVATVTEDKTSSVDTVSYLYANSLNSPYSVYYRPVVGGERKEVDKFEANEQLTHHDSRGKIAVFAKDGNSIHVSSDGGRTYKSILTLDASEYIIGIKISGDGQRLAFATAPSVDSTTQGTIYSINLQGKDKKLLIAATENSMFLIGYNESANKLAFREGCAACDGAKAVTGYKVYDLKTKKSTDLLPGVDVLTVMAGDTNFSDDMKSFIYVASTIGKSIKYDAIPGYYEGAPYTVTQVDVATGKATKVTTIGTKKEKNANGTDKYRYFFSGFLDGTNVPYYAEGLTVHKVIDSKPELLFTATTAIKNVHFVSPKNIVLSTQMTTNDYLLTNYDVATKKSNQILEGDSQTLIIGVTTK